MFTWMYACLRIAIFLFLKLPCVPMLWISPAPVSMIYALLDLHSQFCNIKFTFLAISVKFYVYLNNLIVFYSFYFPTGCAFPTSKEPSTKRATAAVLHWENKRRVSRMHDSRDPEKNFKETQFSSKFWSSVFNLHWL